MLNCLILRSVKNPNYESISAKKMIKHIIMFKLKDFGSEDIKYQKLNDLKKIIDELQGKIREIVSIEAGINISTRDNAYDLVLVSDFKNEEDLRLYIIHPEHQKLVEFLKNIRLSSTVVDYNYVSAI